MNQLTREQRYTISVMLKANHKQIDIAKAIGKHKSVISREIKRNCDLRSKEYKFELACRKTEERSKKKRKRMSFTTQIQAYVESLLKEDYSPEQIVGISRKENIECVSVERIYQHIWEDKRHGGVIYKYLRGKGKRYKNRGLVKDKRGQIVNRKDISERPKIVENRDRFGDLEIDTIIGKDHKGAILTINDRATGVLRMRKLKSRNSEELAIECIDILKPWVGLIKTITSDNGKEFACHQTIAKQLKLDFYFATPYHSWERGSNENLNGLIRQYIPKKTNFDKISDEYVQFIQDKLNNRPRKRYNFESPNFMLNQKLH